MARNKSEFDGLRHRIQSVRAFAVTLDPGCAIKAELAKYLCILGSGLVEAKLRTGVSILVNQTKPRKSVGNAAVAYAGFVKNPRFDRLVAVIKVLDAGVATKIEALSGSASAALNSIMTNRHQIAHGRDCNISYAQVCGYIDELDAIFTAIDKLA